MAIDNSNSATTRLLTLLNVSATKKGKRKRAIEDAPAPVKLNKRRTVRIVTEDGPENISMEVSEVTTETKEVTQSPSAFDVVAAEGDGNALEKDEDDAEGDEGELVLVFGMFILHTNPFPEQKKDPYELHFGAKSVVLTTEAREAVEQRAWTTTREKHGRLGRAVESVPQASAGPSSIKDSFRSVVSKPHLSLRRELWKLSLHN